MASLIMRELNNLDTIYEHEEMFLGHVPVERKWRLVNLHLLKENKNIIICCIRSS